MPFGKLVKSYEYFYGLTYGSIPLVYMSRSTIHSSCTKLTKLVLVLQCLSATKLKSTKTLTDILKALQNFSTNPFKLKLVWAPYGYIMKNSFWRPIHRCLLFAQTQK